MYVLFYNDHKSVRGCKLKNSQNKISFQLKYCISCVTFPTRVYDYDRLIYSELEIMPRVPIHGYDYLMLSI